MSMDEQSTARDPDVQEDVVDETAPEADKEPVATEVAQDEGVPEAANDEGEPQSNLIEGSDDDEEDSEEDTDEDPGEDIANDVEAADYVLDEEHIRMAEALLFAAAEPLNLATLADRMPEGIHFPTVLEALQKRYENHGVHLLNVAGKWAFRTAPDLSFMMEKERVEQRRLSRAGIETLAIIAYHQPVTRAEIEAIRGVSVSKGTIDVLMEIGWIKLRGRRRVPGRPVLYGTTEDFLDHFALDTVKDLPGMEELKAAGLLDARLPPGFGVPSPDDTLPDDDIDDDDDDDQEDLFGGDMATPFDDGDDLPE